MSESETDPLDAFYLALDQALAERHADCSGCGKCCHFEKAGHILYASSLERRRLARAIPVEPPDASPEQIAAGERCPFQKDNRCMAQNVRTLGCRLHFCQEEGNAAAEEFAEVWHRKLKQLHEEVGMAWDYRPALPLPAANEIKNTFRPEKVVP